MPRCFCYHCELTIYVIDVDRFVSDKRPSMGYRYTGKWHGSLVICTKCGVVTKYQQAVPSAWL